MTERKDLYGLVLAGGKSSRMGENKSMISFHNRPQVEFLNELLLSFCDKIFVSCREGQSLSGNLYPLFDQFDLQSPLNGILSAFQKFPDQAWLTVPVDMPNVDSKALEFLLANRDKTKIATCFYDSDGRLPEPLFTIWEKKSKGPLMDFYKEGGFSPRDFLAGNDICLVEAPNPKILVNINTADELKDWRNQFS